MKPPIKYLNVLLVLITVSCSQTNLHCQNIIKTSSDSALVIEEINVGIYIDYDRTKVIDYLYVIDKDGTDFKQRPDTNSETLGKYSYGEKLDIIEVKGPWFGVRDRLTRRIIENGRVIERTAWEKVYVEKSRLGELNQITLIDKDLNVVSSFTQDGKTEYFEDNETLDDYLKIELIDKYAYEKGKTSVVSYVDNNTLLFQKSDGIIELKCADTIVRYIDKPDAEEDVQILEYVGQVDCLDMYIITGSYWEWRDYKYIDKTTGKEIQSFIDFPYLSSDKKYIICISANGYESTADLELFKIINNKPQRILSKSFRNWMPIEYSKGMFWCTDGYFYFRLIHSSAFWKEDGSLNDQFQYARLKIL